MSALPVFWRVVAPILLSMSLIVGGDAASKLVVQAGFSPVFVAWAWFAVAAVILLPCVQLQRGELRLFANLRLFLRSGLIVGGISYILAALRTEPMANVFGGLFVGPVVAYGLSVLLLGERVTPARTLLLLISFGGVLVVVRPVVGAGTGGSWWVFSWRVSGGNTLDGRGKPTPIYCCIRNWRSGRFLLLASGRLGCYC